MISPSLERLRESRRDNSYGFAPHCVADKQETSLAHADDSKSVFAVVLAFVQPIEREWVFEDLTRSLERNAVTGKVRGGFDVIPLEILIIH